MDRKDNMPLWVFLGLLNLETRKAALLLVSCTLVFGLVFLPMPYLLDDWNWMDVVNWSGMMFAITLWYWLSIRWVDKHSSWN
ncbi:MAG: hypothetical protein QMC02_04565 [Halioglobus sp.]